MQIPAGVESDGCMGGVQYGWGVRRKHILFDMQCM
jgi:hypothetical protein